MPGRRSIEGNCKANELAREGKTPNIHPDKVRFLQLQIKNRQKHIQCC